MNTAPEEDAVPYGARLGQVAAEGGDGTAVVFVDEDGSERSITWNELESRSTQLAHLFDEQGLGVGDRLAVCLRNSPEHLLSCFAGWKVGATVVPVRWDLPAWELTRLLAVLKPDLVVDADHVGMVEDSRSYPTTPMPEVTAPIGWGVCSSGSTGTPKVIVQKGPAIFLHSTNVTSSVVASYGPMSKPQLVLCPAPLYHTNGFTAFRTLLGGDPIVLMERFNAPLVLDLIERHAITGFIAATPMLQRLAQVPGIEARDLSSLNWVQQGAAPLPVWLGQFWIDLVGPENFYMSYGASEMIGIVVCRGDEWLAHPGTLGRGMGETEVRVLGPAGEQLPSCEIGGIYLRTPTGPLAAYVGKDVKPMDTTDDGFASVGDVGWLDEEGFLYMADRRVDMIVTGGVNVFPAEVEAALSEHPGIGDVVIVGLSDEAWGRRVHAIVAPIDPSLDAEDVMAFAKERLAPYKVPKTVEFVAAIPRTEAMKFNRAALVAERDGRVTGTEV
ncbi:MAG: AMP-binding protein [Acidimicrobiales bacterium]|jgi:bile acid-coenzyme A ligase